MSFGDGLAAPKPENGKHDAVVRKLARCLERRKPERFCKGKAISMSKAKFRRRLKVGSGVAAVAAAKGFIAILSAACVFAMVLAVAGAAKAQDLKVCKSTFALCTIAQCDPIPGNDKQVACHCTVNIGFSAGAEPCSSVKNTPDGQEIHSRYYPVKSYASCSNDRSWAWCLDKPCLIDKNNPEAATCTCDLVKNLGAYVIVTSHYTPATCTTGVISSATIPQIDQATASLKKAKVLMPFPIEVLNK